MERNNLVQLGNDQLQSLLIKVCDAISGVDRIDGVNLQNRPILTDNGAGHGFVLGTTLSGLRSASIVKPGNKVRGLVKTAIRQNLPVVFHMFSPANPSFATGRAIQLKSTTFQEMYDMAILSHMIAEYSLLPVVHHIQLIEEDTELRELSDQDLTTLLGTPADQIKSPTASQEILFGLKRRRILKLHNVDLPVTIGAKKHGRLKDLSQAARRVYFYDHAKEVIESCFSGYAKTASRLYSFWKEANATRANYLLLCIDGQFESLKNRFSGEKKVGCLEPVVFIGTDAPTISQDLKPTSVFCINSLKAAQLQVDWLSQQVSSTQERVLVKFAGPWQEDYSQILKEKIDSGSYSTHLDLGIQYFGKSNLPSHQVLNQQVERGYPFLKNREGEMSQEPTTTSEKRPIPFIARQFRDSVPPYASLVGFNNNCGYFTRNNLQGAIYADPFQAFGVVPALTSELSQPTTQSVPTIDTAKCTACGKCMIQCPYSALPSGLLSVDQLLEAAASMASDSGTPFKGMIPYVKNWGKAISKHIRNLDQPSIQLHEVLEAGFNNLMEQLKAGEDKEKELFSEVEPVLEAFGQMAAVVSDKLFYTPEKVEKGSGALFILTPDNDSCTGCNVCSRICPERAILMTDINSSAANGNDANLAISEKLPDTSVDWINRLLEDESYSSLAALMLSKSFYLNVAGGASKKSELFRRTMLHLVSVVIESIQQPRVSAQLSEIKELISGLDVNIHKQLADQLPHFDASDIGKAVNGNSGDRVGLEDTLDKLTKLKLRDKDKKDIERKAELIHSLRTLSEVIESGDSGVGRSRYSVIMDEADSEWAADYPDNPFMVPNVILWHQGISSVAEGIMNGHLRHYIDNIKLIRRARLELEGNYDSHTYDPLIAGMGWDDLTTEEKLSAPPLLVMGTEKLLTSSMWSELGRLLSTDLPLKVIVMDSLAINPGDVGAIARSNAEMISLMTLGNAFVCQGSLADQEKLFDNLVSGLKTSEPSFFKLFTPVFDDRNNSSSDLEVLSAIACNSRAFVSMAMGTNSVSRFLNSKLDLSGNEDVTADFVESTIYYDEQEFTFGLTWADWALTKEEYAHCFTEAAAASDQVPVSEFVTTEDRKGIKPIVVRLKEGTLIRYLVNEEIIAMVEASLRSWQTIQEIAGVVTAFPEKMVEAVKEELAERHEQEIAQLKQDFEKQLSEVENSQKQLLKNQLKNKLVQLANSRG